MSHRHAMADRILAGVGLKAHRVDAPFAERYTLRATVTPGSEG